MLDVETKISENSFVTIVNDAHWFVTQFSVARKKNRLNLLPFSPKNLTISLQKIIQLFTILKNQRKLATKITEKSVFWQKYLFCMSRLYYSTLIN
jgi:hypothetical protein